MEQLPRWALMQEHWIEIQGTRIHYLQAGDTGPGIILLHGGGSDSASLSWTVSIPGLAECFRVFAPDLPGYGASGQPEVPYTIEYFTRFLADFAAALQLDRFHLIGLSMGGQIALNYALRAPDRLERLVLVSTAGIGLRPRWAILAKTLNRAPRLYEIMRRMGTATPERLRLGMRNIVYDPQQMSRAFLEEIRTAVRAPGAGRAWRFYLQNELTWTGFRTDLLGRLKEIRCPTLIVHGLHDRMIPVHRARAAHERIPASELRILEHCGHWPQREQPEVFNQVVLEFLTP